MMMVLVLWWVIEMEWCNLCDCVYDLIFEMLFDGDVELGVCLFIDMFVC